MTAPAGSILDLVERIQQRGPSSLSLFTAQTDEDFEKAFDVWLERAVIGLEGNKAKFQSLDEDGLSGTLALALTMPGVTVTRET